MKLVKEKNVLSKVERPSFSHFSNQKKYIVMMCTQKLYPREVIYARHIFIFFVSNFFYKDKKTHIAHISRRLFQTEVSRENSSLHYFSSLFNFIFLAESYFVFLLSSYMRNMPEAREGKVSVTYKKMPVIKWTKWLIKYCEQSLHKNKFFFYLKIFQFIIYRGEDVRIVVFCCARLFSFS